MEYKQSMEIHRRNILDVFANLIRALECPVCYDYVSSPIWQCNAGHIICGSCKSKIKVSSCPTCRQLFSSARVRSLEQISDIMIFPCENEGCEQMLPLNEIHTHKARCNFSGARGNLVGEAKGRVVHCNILKHIENNIVPFLVTANKNQNKQRDEKYLTKTFKETGTMTDPSLRFQSRYENFKEKTFNAFYKTNEDSKNLEETSINWYSAINNSTHSHPAQVSSSIMDFGSSSAASSNNQPSQTLYLPFPVAPTLFGNSTVSGATAPKSATFGLRPTAPVFHKFSVPGATAHKVSNSTVSRVTAPKSRKSTERWTAAPTSSNFTVCGATAHKVSNSTVSGVTAPKSRKFTVRGTAAPTSSNFTVHGATAQKVSNSTVNRVTAPTSSKSTVKGTVAPAL